MHITQFLPKRSMSLFMGWLMHTNLPWFLKGLGIYILIKKYKINVEESGFSPYEYATIGDFFTRHLKPDCRQLASTWCVHPADAEVTMSDLIQHDTLVQAKGKTYTLSELVDHKVLSYFHMGSYAVYYLSPKDYHRIHSPVDGTITRVVHIPGKLWPVNTWSINNIHKLFAINERVYVEIMTDRGYVGVTFVGATNVGHIELTFEGTPFRNNQKCPYKTMKEFTCSIPIAKGSELGAFHMGSTIVMLYDKDTHAKIPLGCSKVKAAAFE